MDDYFWIDGIRSDLVGIRLQRPVTFSGTTPKISSVPVPGRNGDLHYNDGAYNNVEGEASCFALQERYIDTALNAISKWSLMEPGYHRLETSEEPNIYRMAEVISGPETEIRMKVLAPFTLKFDCMPQKFIKRGEKEISIARSGTIIRNEWFPALPVIKITGGGVGTLSINGLTMQFRESFSGPVIYDADTENAYWERENKNKEIYAPDRLILPSGNCEITWSGGVESVTITPRWWTL